MLYEQFENPGENPNHDVRLSNSTPRGIHIPSWWEDALSLAAMDQGDGAGLQPALEYLFPYSHGEISQADKASLQHNQLCSVEALMQQKRAPGGFSALQDLSEETRMKLTEGTDLASEREAITRTMPRVREHPRSRKKTTKTRSPLTRTCAPIKRWDSLENLAQAAEDGLSDNPTLLRSELPPSRDYGPYFKESTVQRYMQEQLQTVNLVAAARNQPSYFDEGGQDSTETEVDFVARHVEELIAGQLPEPSAADVSAACEMKGWNQVNVSEGETYNSIVRDFKKLKEVVPSWQQAFGYAVKEQVALFTVCNYEMTFFIKRSAVPGDKTIFVSDPIFYNRQGPSARSFWLAFLLLSRARFAEKATLAEAQVPATSEEGEPFLITPGHGGGQPFAVRLKAKDYSSCVLELAPGETAALIGGSSSSASGSSASGSAGSSASSSAGSSASEAEHEAEAEALPPMTSTELAAGPPVHHGSHSFIKQGWTDGVRTAIKCYDAADEAALNAYQAEVDAYNSPQLHHLQGDRVPRLIRSGLLHDPGSPPMLTIVLQHIGPDLAAILPLTRQQKRAAGAALSAFHRSGAAHGDICLENLVWDSARARVL